MNRLKFLLIAGAGLLFLAAVSILLNSSVEAQVGSTPVRVVNLAAAPALIRDVDRPYAQPFALTGFLPLDPGSNDATTIITNSNPIPAGKRFLIQNVNAQANMPSGENPALFINVLNDGRTYTIPFRSQGDFGGAGTLFAGNEALPIAINGGVDVQFFFRRGPILSGNASLFVEVSGYLVDM
jgi:hypothetical protein